MFNDKDVMNAARIMSKHKGSLWVDVSVIGSAAALLPKIEGVRFLRNIYEMTLREAEAALVILKGRRG